MAKNDSFTGGLLFKTGIFAVLAGAAFWLFNQFSGKKEGHPMDTQSPIEQTHSRPRPTVSKVPDELVPQSSSELVRHTWYVLGYAEDHEQAEWVAYELTRENLNNRVAERSNMFRPDPDVRTESATPRDYTGSGYDKGHLCPAADMAFDQTAMDESFLMSNISPQEAAFNMGIWRELEELARDWSRKFGRLYVVTGPVLTLPGKGQIGFSKVTVPAAYYKILLAPEQEQAIAFLIPNQISDRPVMEYACNIDKVEKVTSIDFFPRFRREVGDAIEANLDKGAWPINSVRYQQRVKEWNGRRGAPQSLSE